MKRFLTLLLAAMLLTGCAALGEGLPPIRQAEPAVAVPDPALVLSGPGELYQMSMPYGDALFDAYYYPQPADRAEFEAAYSELLCSSGITPVGRVTSAGSPDRIGAFDQMMFTWTVQGRKLTGYILLDYGKDILFLVPSEAGFTPGGGASQPSPVPGSDTADADPAVTAGTEASAPAAYSLDPRPVMSKLDAVAQSLDQRICYWEDLNATTPYSGHQESQQKRMEAMRTILSLMSTLDQGPDEGADPYGWVFGARCQALEVYDRLTDVWEYRTQQLAYEAYALLDDACIAMNGAPKDGQWLTDLTPYVVDFNGANIVRLTWNDFAASHPGGYYAVYWQFPGNPDRHLEILSSGEKSALIPAPAETAFPVAVYYNPAEQVFPAVINSQYAVTARSEGWNESPVKIIPNGNERQANGVHLVKQVGLGEQVESSSVPIGTAHLKNDSGAYYFCKIAQIGEEDAGEYNFTFVLTTPEGWSFVRNIPFQVNNTKNDTVRKIYISPLLLEYWRCAGARAGQLTLRLYIDGCLADTQKIMIAD